jgi:hypothetical protein
VKRLTELALACYPPSWQERYGKELRELAGDGDTFDLFVGAARAWLHPAGQRTAGARRLSAISTVYVSWCVAYVGALVYLKAVDDPPLPGLTTGASQPLWGLAKATFFLGWVVVMLGGTALLVRIAIPALRRRDWHVLRPMLPAAILLVVLGTMPLVGSYGNGAPSLGPVIVILSWLALGFGLVVAGAIGPVASLRRSGLSAETLRLPTLAAVGVTVMAAGLAVATTTAAVVLTDRTDLYNATMMWGAVALMAGAALASSVSVGRALHAR